MPDISMCQNSECPQCGTCYRFLAKPDPYSQLYADFKPDDKGECGFYKKAFEVDDE